MELDIRSHVETKVTSIRVASSDSRYMVVDTLSEGLDVCGIKLEDSQDTDVYLRVLDKNHAENLIKGLQKAIELEWVV